MYASSYGCYWFTGEGWPAPWSPSLDCDQRTIPNQSHSEYHWEQDPKLKNSVPYNHIKTRKCLCSGLYYTISICVPTTSQLMTTHIIVNGLSFSQALSLTADNLGHTSCLCNH